MSDIEVVVNGETRRVRTGTRVAELVDDEDCDGIAIARNGTVVRRGEWATVALAPGDEVEIVRAVQGG